MITHYCNYWVPLPNTQVAAQLNPSPLHMLIYAMADRDLGHMVPQKSPEVQYQQNQRTCGGQQESYTISTVSRWTRKFSITNSASAKMSNMAVNLFSVMVFKVLFQPLNRF